MSLATFAASNQGRSIDPLLRDPLVVDEMIRLSRAGKPAVAVLDQRLAGKFELSNVERQYVGRQVRDVLAARGWSPVCQRRLSAGKLFTSGTVYGPAHAKRDRMTDVPAGLQSFQERVRRARESVRAFSTNDYGVDDFLRDKRAEADADESR